MKEQLQQIQAVAAVTFICILISVNSTGDYGKWFVIDGARETVDPETGNQTQYNSFQYHYYSLLKIFYNLKNRLQFYLLIL